MLRVAIMSIVALALAALVFVLTPPDRGAAMDFAGTFFLMFGIALPLLGPQILEFLGDDHE